MIVPKFKMLISFNMYNNISQKRTYNSEFKILKFMLFEQMVGFNNNLNGLKNRMYCFRFFENKN